MKFLDLFAGKGRQTLTDKVSSLETRNSELLRENRRLAAENQRLEILLKAADVEIKRLKGEPELEIARFFKMGASPDTPTKRADDLRERLGRGDSVK